VCVCLSACVLFLGKQCDFITIPLVSFLTLLFCVPLFILLSLSCLSMSLLALSSNIFFTLPPFLNLFYYIRFFNFTPFDFINFSILLFPTLFILPPSFFRPVFLSVLYTLFLLLCIYYLPFLIYLHFNHILVRIGYLQVVTAYTIP